MRIVVVCAVAFSACFAGAVTAQSYKWVDRDGKVRYGDRPPAGVKATPFGAQPSLAPQTGAKAATSGPQPVTAPSAAPAVVNTPIQQAAKSPPPSPIDKNMEQLMQRKAEEARRVREEQRLTEVDMGNKNCTRAKEVQLAQGNDRLAELRARDACH